MQAVILAAGLGTRMGELTKNKPKPLLTIENKTILEHTFAALPEEVTEVVLVVGYLKENIQKYIGDSHQGKKVVYIEQKELKGTGHALANCKEVLHDKFIVLMGDDLYEKKDLEEMVKHPLSILVREIKEDSTEDKYALAKLNGGGKLSDIIERQKAKTGDLANCGAYVLDTKYFDYPLVVAGNKTEEYGLPQTFMQMVRDGAQMDIVRATKWHNVTNPEDLKEGL